ncbi:MULTISPECIES: hypothetical protein [Paraburkholderia]|uniref:hypothetical protein n=1 Tax=Paraburkholderia TaxID=1822464 RepID=UPI001EF8D509|nr:MULTISPECIES: hypothetical protein [Paraburkholderia]MDH6148201.1 hypothetical protein [Paraburkholderia sp. WSM4179]
MNYLIRLSALGSISIASLLAACTTAGPTASTALPKSVPDISVLVDCGSCQVRSTVPELIRRGYVEAAAKAGVQVVGDSQTTLTIKDYTERGVAVRSASFVVSLLFPPLAYALTDVKDEIKADALVDGKQVSLEYDYRIPFFGIETVAQKLGERTFQAAVK